MNEKKIEFSKKPTAAETNKFIDDWVFGNKSQMISKRLKRTTIYLPQDLHSRLKILAVDTNTSMTNIIINTLEKYIKTL